MKKYDRRKIVLSLIFFSILLFLSGFAENAEDTMYIDAAHLTEEEQNIASLLGAGNDQLLFDFEVDDTIKSIQVNTYQLMDGEWEMESGGGRIFEDASGRLALGFDNLPEGLRVAFQSENHAGSDKYETDLNGAELPASRATTSLRNRVEIEYEKEIPLVIQILTSKNAIRSDTVEGFYTPEKYAEENYEYVYAITIRFSQKTVNELDQELN